MSINICQDLRLQFNSREQLFLSYFHGTEAVVDIKGGRDDGKSAQEGDNFVDEKVLRIEKFHNYDFLIFLLSLLTTAYHLPKPVENYCDKP